MKTWRIVRYLKGSGNPPDIYDTGIVGSREAARKRKVWRLTYAQYYKLTPKEALAKLAKEGTDFQIERER